MTYHSLDRDDSSDTPALFYSRRLRVCRELSWEQLQEEDLEVAQITHPENLLATFDEMKARAGMAPGPDQVTYDEIGRSEIASIFRFTSMVCRLGYYRPSPPRPVSILKTSGTGRRTLKLRSIVDRVVSSALHRVLTLWWDRLFMPMWYGFRPGRSHHDLLADLLATIVAQERFVIAIDGVRAAFDNLRIAEVVEDHQFHVPYEKLNGFIERVLRGGDDIDRTVGIDQGDPFSPLALNVRLHHVHDLPLTEEDRSPPAYRYADNLAYLCRSVSEGQQTLLQSQELLAEAGLTLKGDDGPPTDLQSGAVAQLLGFSLSVEDGQPRLGLGDFAWTSLEQNLVQAHERDNPIESARTSVLDWIAAHGPAFGRREDVFCVEQILRVAACMGFRELGSREELRRRQADAHDRWELRHRAACQRRGIGWG